MTRSVLRNGVGVLVVTCVGCGGGGVNPAAAPTPTPPPPRQELFKSPAPLELVTFPYAMKHPGQAYYCKGSDDVSLPTGVGLVDATVEWTPATAAPISAVLIMGGSRPELSGRGHTCNALHPVDGCQASGQDFSGSSSPKKLTYVKVPGEVFAYVYSCNLSDEPVMATFTVGYTPQ